MDHNSKTSRQTSLAPSGTPKLADALVLWALFMGPIFALLLFVLPAFAQAIPENASAKSYGDGWECNIGYRLNGDTCIGIVAPENAYETNRPYGLGWECHHGFRKVEDTACVEVAVPEGGFLDRSGERWRCLRGFRKVDGTCQQVVVPENAYMNGARYGQPWTCERGFFEKDGLCQRVVVPEFAYFDDATYGTGWKCQRGYEVSGSGCEAIDIPANAHLDQSGNRWECNRRFQKSKGQCVFNN